MIQFLKKNPELAKKWLRAHVRALLLMRQSAEEAAQIAAKELKLDRDVAREATTQAVSFMSAELGSKLLSSAVSAART